LNHPFDGTPEEAASALERQLMESIGAQMLADVPLGAFLSGGIDSSIIVALMQAQSPRPIQTFTIGFDDRRYDEAQYALAVARRLGTHHTELYMRPEDALSVIDLLPGIYDEPFADSSQIPTFLVSRLARQHVTVALSGDAGDELFGGYGTYQPFTRAIAKSGGCGLGEPFHLVVERRIYTDAAMAAQPTAWRHEWRTAA
jgi:asparagine synthase (glutamine-hydrolysing)